VKLSHPQLQALISEEISAADVKPLFDKLISQLGALDKSIDFLAASVTGMDPFDIDIAQSAYGRFASPHRQSRTHGRASQNIDEDKTGSSNAKVAKGYKAADKIGKLFQFKEQEMKLTTAQIREMVTEVLEELNEKKKENWVQKASAGIEKKGSEGAFTKYCDGDVTQACVDKAAKEGSPERKKQAAFAANVNSKDGLVYPTEEKE